jgi:hypothetical protein
MTHRKLTERQAASILRLRETTDLTAKEIGERFGVGRKTVFKVCNDAGITRGWNRWTEDEDEFLRLNYETHGPSALVKFLPRHPSADSISARARHLGLRASDPNRYGVHRERLRLIEGGME